MPFLFLYFILFCALSSVDTSQESCLGTVVNGIVFNANLMFAKDYTLKLC